MKESIKIPISPNEANYIEGLDYEQSARRDIISFMLEKNMNVNTDAFKQYQKEQSVFHAEFQMAKQEIEQRYIPEEWKGHQVNWSLDYHTCIMSIEKLCDC